MNVSGNKKGVTAVTPIFLEGRWVAPKRYPAREEDDEKVRLRNAIMQHAHHFLGSLKKFYYFIYNSIL